MTLTSVFYCMLMILFWLRKKNLNSKKCRVLREWCNKWRLSINVDKTQIVHFRIPSALRSKSDFYFGQTQLMYSGTYKYLGFVFHENMTFRR